MMNSRFTDEQIRIYASQFREGDAIWCNGKWWEVVTDLENLTNKLTINSNDNSFFINDGEKYSFDAFLSGFTRTSKKPYRVTTLRDYELQSGEKIVWLGENGGSRTFGKTYSVVNGHSYYNDKGHEMFISSSYWGIIPRYEQVENNKQIDTNITLTPEDIEKLNQFNSVFHDSKHLVELLDSLGSYEQANELTKNLLSVKEVVDNVDRQRNQIAKELMRKECNL